MFSSQVKAVNGAKFLSGNGPIWLDEVDCGYYDVGLSSCNRRELGYHDCTHSEDAGVICGGKLKSNGKYLKYFILHSLLWLIVYGFSEIFVIDSDLYSRKEIDLKLNVVLLRLSKLICRYNLEKKTY